MQSIDARELKMWLDQGKDFQLIDVRELSEYLEYNINAEHIPMGDILGRIFQISKDKKVVVHCRSGRRSAQVIERLQAEYPYDNLYNLKGGILAWQDLQKPNTP